MCSVLFKIWVTRFYKINTGFFLLLFLLLFALLDGPSTIKFHQAIMRGITGSYAFLGGAMLVWALYSFKCVNFCLKEIHQPANSILFRLQSISNKRQFRLLLACHSALFAPLLLYAAITIVLGIREHHYLLAGIFLLYQLAMCGIGAGVYFQQLNNTWKKPAFTLPAILIIRKKHFLFYLIHYSLSNRKSTFIGIKFFSLLLLQAMLATNSNKLNKESVCILIMFLISAHALLPYYYVRFIEGELGLLRNLPITIAKRGFIFVITYAIIFIPELLFLLLNGYNVLPIPLIFSLYMLGICQLSLYTALQYLKNMHSDRYTTVVFGLFFISLILLASFNLWLFALLEAIVAIFVFVWKYNGFDSSSLQKADEQL
jgi:hypothetical protein